jgi:signal peptidase I
VGNADQLTAGRRSARPGGRGTDKAGAKTWRRSLLYGAGTVSMLIVSMITSLSLWIALPWAFLGWSPTLVTSGSMQPLVAPGDVVMIRSVTAEELTPNSVILYDRPETGRVLHRILEAHPDGTYLTGGDANASPDSAFVHFEDVQGAAVLAVPWIGRPSLWLAEQRWALVGLTGAALIVILALAPRAFDPAFDPWSSGRRVAPAEVLLGRESGAPSERRATNSRGLLPEKMHALVLDRLANQSAAAQRRTAHLLGCLS